MSPILKGIVASQISGHLSTNSFESIATITVSSPATTFTFSSIPSTYKHLQVRLIGRTGRTDYTIEDVNLQMNSDTGSNYSWHRLYSNPNIGSSNVLAAASASATYINSVGILSTNSASTYMVGASIIDILDYTNTGKYTTVRSFTGVDNNSETNGTGVTGFVEFSSGAWLNTAAVTSLTFSNTTGTQLVSPTKIHLYGIKG